MTSLGSFALIIAAVLAIYVCVSLYSWLSDKKRNHPYEKLYRVTIGIFMSVSAATILLLMAFIKQDFSFDYVTKYSSPDMPLYLKAAALWAGQAGSMLFWLFLLSGITAFIAYQRRNEPDRLTSYTLLILNVVQLFFLAVIILIQESNPFLPGSGTPGTGLNPLLQHWAMVLHPPTLFLGYAGFTVPFAYAMAALLAKDSSREWVERSHKWTLFAWFFLSAGIILGALWAYVVLGWGGYWGWDPVENASLIPWLTGIGLLHSITAYRRRGNLKLWTAALATATFVLCIVATFVTRSGLIQSVHAYEQNMPLTVLFGGFMIGTVMLSYHLISTNRRRFAQDDQFESLASKQFTYYLNNLLMAAFAGIVVFASMIQPFFGRMWVADNYNLIARPLGILYLGVLIACPLMGWVKTEKEKLYKRLMVPGIVTAVAALPIWLAWSPTKAPVHMMDLKIVGFVGQLIAVFLFVSVIELFVIGAQTKAKNRGIGFASALWSIFRYNRSTAGGYIAHLGVAIAMFGVVASTMYVTETKATVNGKQPGSTATIGSYELKYKGFQSQDRGSNVLYGATFDLFKNGRPLGEITVKNAYFKAQQSASHKVAIAGASALFNPKELKLKGGSLFDAYNLAEDLFISMEDVDPGNPESIPIELKINPLIGFVWLGSLILMLGTVYAYVPKRAAEPIPSVEGTKKRKLEPVAIES